MSEELILVINPGSTSTKVAVFGEYKEFFKTNISHSAEKLKEYKSIVDQYIFRKDAIIKIMNENNVNFDSIKCIAARGGLLKPGPSGVYAVNEKMVSDLKNCKYGEHASNLGAIIAYDLSKDYNIPAFIADPVTVDEMDKLAKFTGLKGLERRSIFHALNQKYIARKFSKENNKKYEDLNLIVVHMGGGISIGVHKNGRVIDVNNALNGDGPYSPERAGTLPTLSLAGICFSNKYTKSEMLKNLAGKGGFVSHLGTNDAKEVENSSLNGDSKAKLIIDGMIYQISKGIGEASTVLGGKVDAIIFTGGIAKSEFITSEIKSYVDYIAPIFVYPGENEMEALSENVFRVLKGEIKPSIYE